MIQFAMNGVIGFHLQLQDRSALDVSRIFLMLEAQLKVQPNIKQQLNKS